MTEAIFAERTVPWSGIGKTIERAKNSKEAMKMAGLDWDVVSTPLYLPRGKGYEKIQYFANVRADTGDVLGIVTSRYKVLQNREIFSFTDKLIGEGVQYEAAGQINGGKRIWLLASMPEDKIVLGEKIKSYIIWVAAHDGDRGVIGAITPIRVLCYNTINLALKVAKRSWSAVHMGDMDSKLIVAQKTLGSTYLYLNEMEMEVEKLAQIKITKETLGEIVEELYPVKSKDSDRRVANIEELREGLLYRYHKAPDLKRFRGTGWGLISAVSDFVTHSEPKRRTATYKEKLFEKVIDGHPIIDKAYHLIKKVA